MWLFSEPNQIQNEGFGEVAGESIKINALTSLPP